jgi:hypothetical protein
VRSVFPYSTRGVQFHRTKSAIKNLYLASNPDVEIGTSSAAVHLNKLAPNGILKLEYCLDTHASNQCSIAWLVCYYLSFIQRDSHYYSSISHYLSASLNNQPSFISRRHHTQGIPHSSVLWPVPLIRLLSFACFHRPAFINLLSSTCLHRPAFIDLLPSCPQVNLSKQWSCPVPSRQFPSFLSCPCFTLTPSAFASAHELWIFP